MEADLDILRDVQMRLKALEEARRLRGMVAGAQRQLEAARAGVTSAEFGTAAEQQFLREAAEASTNLAALRESLYAAERELRRTAYLLEALSE